MTRLQLELDRLYGLGAESADVRALVLELVQPASWDELSAVWTGVQSDLELPPPAIAVSGVDALQLWFSLAAPVSREDGARFLDGLRARYLPELAPSKLRAIVAPASLPPAPPLERGPERWSAFVSSDLASVFADTPWLEVAPSEDGQAALLRTLAPIPREAFDAALGRLGAATPAASAGMQSADADPARFLARVMNDEAAPLALRIEAAKALLSHDRRS